MPHDGFLNVAGIPGESTDDKHAAWIELLYYSHGATQPSSATASSAGGGSTERVTHHPFVIRKEIDKASPLLMQACASGKHLATVTMQVNRAGGDKLQYYEVKMEQVVVSSVDVELTDSIDWSGSGGSGDSPTESKVSMAAAQGSTIGSFPIETVTFDYGKIKWTYTQQKRADGSGGGNVTGGWDLTANKVYS